MTHNRATTTKKKLSNTEPPSPGVNSGVASFVYLVYFTTSNTCDFHPCANPGCNFFRLVLRVESDAQLVRIMVRK